MKTIKRLPLSFLIIIFGFCFALLTHNGSINAAGGVKLDKAHFSKDMISYCKREFDSNGDGYLSQSEISKAKLIDEFIDVKEKYVDRDYKGIEYLTSLEKIYLEKARISNFNIYKLPKLKSIKCINCKFKKKGINFDKLKDIEELVFDGTDVKYKGDFRKNTKLKVLSVRNANVNKVNLKKLKRLKDFGYSGNMKKINLSKNINLECLNINIVSADKIDISHNKKLKELHIGGSVKSFDLKKNKKLTDIELSSDVCPSIDISGFDKLEQLKLDMPSADIRVTNNSSLRTLEIKSNMNSVTLAGNDRVAYCEIDAPLDKFDASIFGKLKNLKLSNIHMDEFKPISNSVRNLELNDCNVPCVDLSALHNLKYVEIVKGSIKNVVLSDNNAFIAQIHVLECNSLSEIEVGDLKNIKTIIMEGNNEYNDDKISVEEWLDAGKKTIIVKPDLPEYYISSYIPGDD